MHTGFCTALEVAGSHGLLEFKSERTSPLTITRHDSDAAAPRVAVPQSTLIEEPYTRELQHFVDCLRTGAEPLVTAADGRAVLALALTAIDSARENRPIHLEGGAVR